MLELIVGKYKILLSLYITDSELKHNGSEVYVPLCGRVYSSLDKIIVKYE